MRVGYEKVYIHDMSVSRGHGSQTQKLNVNVCSFGLVANFPLAKCRLSRKWHWRNEGVHFSIPASALAAPPVAPMANSRLPAYKQMYFFGHGQEDMDTLHSCCGNRVSGPRLTYLRDPQTTWGGYLQHASGTTGWRWTKSSSNWKLQSQVQRSRKGSSLRSKESKVRYR